MDNIFLIFLILIFYLKYCLNMIFIMKMQLNIISISNGPKVRIYIFNLSINHYILKTFKDRKMSKSNKQSGLGKALKNRL